MFAINTAAALIAVALRSFYDKVYKLQVPLPDSNPEVSFRPGYVAAVSFFIYMVREIRRGRASGIVRQIIALRRRLLRARYTESRADRHGKMSMLENGSEIHKKNKKFAAQLLNETLADSHSSIVLGPSCSTLSVQNLPFSLPSGFENLRKLNLRYSNRIPNFVSQIPQNYESQQQHFNEQQKQNRAFQIHENPFSLDQRNAEYQNLKHKQSVSYVNLPLRRRFACKTNRMNRFIPTVSNDNPRSQSQIVNGQSYKREDVSCDKKKSERSLAQDFGQKPSSLNNQGDAINNVVPKFQAKKKIIKRRTGLECTNLKLSNMESTRQTRSGRVYGYLNDDVTRRKFKRTKKNPLNNLQRNLCAVKGV